MMEGMAEIYPHYDFASNKGYGSQKHLAGIAQYGICPIHRRTFVKNFLKEDAAPKETGNRGELLAAKEMKKMGYEILAQNYRKPSGEIDIIAQKDGILVFTEVKTRTSTAYGTPCGSRRPPEAGTYHRNGAGVSGRNRGRRQGLPF